MSDLRFLGFVEAVVHAVLYSRRVYPPHLFELRKFHGVPMYVSRAPALSQYIAGILSVGQLGLWLAEGKLHRLVLSINAASSRPVERFVFEVGPLVRLRCCCLRGTPSNTGVGAVAGSKPVAKTRRVVSCWARAAGPGYDGR